MLTNISKPCWLFNFFFFSFGNTQPHGIAVKCSVRCVYTDICCALWVFYSALHSKWNYPLRICTPLQNREHTIVHDYHDRKHFWTQHLFSQIGEEVGPVARVHEGTRPPGQLAANGWAGSQLSWPHPRYLRHCQGGTEEVWGEEELNTLSTKPDFS